MRINTPQVEDFRKQFRPFAAVTGYTVVDQLQPIDMDEYYASWRDGIRSRAKKFERPKRFFKFCVKRKWLAENAAIDIEPLVDAGAAAHRMLFTEPELTIPATDCHEWNGRTS